MSNYQNTLKMYKDLVFEGNADISAAELSRAGIPKEVSDAWRRTKLLGFSPDMPAIAKAGNDKTVLDRLLAATTQNWAVAKGEYLNIGELLGAMGAVLYFLDDHLAIYQYIGNESLKQEMRDRGFKFGYRLSEEFIGIHPANIAQRTSEICIMQGEEHPLEMFRELCSIAMPVVNTKVAPLREFNNQLYDGQYMLLVLVPMKNYNETVETMCRIILNKIIPSCSDNALAGIYAEMFALTEEANQTPTFFMSPDFRIIYLNKHFETEFDMLYEKCVGRQVQEVIPELNFLKDTMKKQSKLKFMKQDINVKGSSRSYYIETRYLRKSGGAINSMRVSLSTQGNVDYYRKNLNVGGNVAVFTFDSLVGNDEAFMEVKRIAMKAADSNSNVLVTGESGTGKELVSQAIHNESIRRDKPFIAINCGSIPKELLGSELFGYEQGAFTGARKDGQIGKIELANGGTLFLDEITEMPLDMQSYLLRVLEERKLYRLGGNKPQNVDVRIIAATNRDLLSYIDEGKFRLDLYFRLNVIKINIPPLRERKDDIAELSNYYVRRFAEQFDKHIDGIEPGAMQILKRYPWPGNVRELRNVIEYSVNMMEGDMICTRDLPAEVAGTKHRDDGYSKKARDEEVKWKGDYKSYEKQQIRMLMMEYKGNKSKVAKEIGISRNTLNKRLQEMQYEE